MEQDLAATEIVDFPEFDLISTIARCLEIAYDRNTSAAIRDLKQRLGELPTDSN